MSTSKYNAFEGIFESLRHAHIHAYTLSGMIYLIWHILLFAGVNKKLWHKFLKS